MWYKHPNMLNKGSHQPARGGLHKAFERAVRDGNNVIQVYSRNPNKRDAPNIPAPTLLKCHYYASAGNLRVFVKAPTRINLATPNEAQQQSILGEMEVILRDAGYLKAEAVVIHPGFHLGSGYRAGLLRAANTLNEALLARGQHYIKVIIQPSAGNGTAIGAQFQDLAFMLAHIDGRFFHLVDVSFDVSNAFAAGYDLRTEAGIDHAISEFTRHIGIEKLACVHLKDSDHPFHSKKEETTILGEGDIGKSALRSIIQHPKLQHVPFIVEQPKDHDLNKQNPNFERLVEWSRK